MDHVGVSGRSLAEIAAEAANDDPEVIRSRVRPVLADGGIAVLRGNLAPDGAVVKLASATPELLSH